MMRRLFSVRTVFLARWFFWCLRFSSAGFRGVIRARWTAGPAGVRAAALSGGGLHVDAGLLGLRR